MMETKRAFDSTTSHGYDKPSMSNWDVFKMHSAFSFHSRLTQPGEQNLRPSITVSNFIPLNNYQITATFWKMSPSVSRSHSCNDHYSITFSGSGFLSIYQLGVALGFLRYSPWILKSAPHILGASAGSLAAATVACELNPSKWTYVGLYIYTD